MREITSTADSLVKWSGVAAVTFKGDRIVVRLTTGQAAIIPSGVPFGQIPRSSRIFGNRIDWHPLIIGLYLGWCGASGFQVYLAIYRPIEAG